MQGVLFFMPSQRRIDPGDIGDRGAAERTGKPLRPNRIAGIARAILGNNRAGDKRRARRKSRRQPPCDTKTDDGRCLLRDGRFQGACKTHGVTAARDRIDARPGDKPRFRLKAGYGDDRGGGHIPPSTGCRLPVFRLRKRAIAQSGKYFA